MGKTWDLRRNTADEKGKNKKKTKGLVALFREGLDAKPINRKELYVL